MGRHLVLLGGEECKIFRDKGANHIAQKTLFNCVVYDNEKYRSTTGNRTQADLNGSIERITEQIMLLRLPSS